MTENECTPNQEPLSREELQAKAAILAECENLAAAGVTFVAGQFDGYGDSGVTEEVQCFDSDYYAYEEQEPMSHDAAYLQEHFETLVPLGYENDFPDPLISRKFIVSLRMADNARTNSTRGNRRYRPDQHSRSQPAHAKSGGR